MLSGYDRLRDWIAPWSTTVDWDAWAAIATAGALIYALWAAGAGRRAQRRRDAATLKTILLAADAFYHICRLSDDQADPRPTEYVVNAVSEWTAVLGGLSAGDMPSTFALDRFIQTKILLSEAYAAATESSTEQRTAALKSLTRSFKATCESVGRECTRFGGHVEEHDQVNLRLWLRHSLGSRVTDMVDRQRKKMLVQRILKTAGYKNTNSTWHT